MSGGGDTRGMLPGQRRAPGMRRVVLDPRTVTGGVLHYAGSLIQQVFAASGCALGVLGTCAVGVLGTCERATPPTIGLSVSHEVDDTPN